MTHAREAADPRPFRAGAARRLFVLLAALAIGASAPLSRALARDGENAVDVELVLAVDVSYSMDPEEQALQRQGYIEAITSPLRNRPSAFTSSSSAWA